MTDEGYEHLLENLREQNECCGQCGKRLGQMVYSDSICPGGRFCSKKCLDDRLAGK